MASLDRGAVQPAPPAADPAFIEQHAAFSDPVQPLGLYLHVPFCQQKCPYCDFNTYAGLGDLFPALVDALGAELTRWQPALAGRTVSTIFIGGGTPTVLAAEQLEQLFAHVHRTLRVAPDAEITCEANPGTVDREKFALLRALGVNRLSLGVQSFQSDELAFLGRIHDVPDVYRAVALARSVGLEQINLDFIFGLPHQRPEAWADTLTQALGLEPAHLSLYSLIVEPNTPLNHWVATGRTDMPDDDLAADLYEMAMARLGDAGYIQYEVSNWATGARTPAHHANPDRVCRHNLIYWRNQEWLGIGPGAHSHLRTTSAEFRWGNRKPVAGYIRRMRSGRPVEEFREEISPRLAWGETMITGLRLTREGVTDEHFRRLHGVGLVDAFDREIRQLVQAGLVTFQDGRLLLTPGGLLLGNRVFAEFLPEAA